MTHIRPAQSEPDTLTLYDLAERWGVSYATVYELAPPTGCLCP